MTETTPEERASAAGFIRQCTDASGMVSLVGERVEALLRDLDRALAEVIRLTAENTKLALNAQNALDVVGAEVARLTAALAETREKLRTKCQEVADVVNATSAREAKARAEERERVAEGLYVESTDNDPNIHSNRFPLWSEMSENAKAGWRKRAAAIRARSQS